MHFGVFAQLSESDFQNFSFQDMNGYEHELYSYLDDGKVVMLDVFATWCPNCVAAIPTVRSLWEERGPQGDDSIVVLKMERDPNTNNEASFVAQHDIMMPVITEAEQFIADLGITYQPVYVVICPDRTYEMHLGSIGDGTVLTDLIDQCGTATSIEDRPVKPELQFFTDNGMITARITSPKNTEIELYNLVGRRIARGLIQAGEQLWTQNGLDTGIYILRLGDDSYKVIVP